MQGSKTWLATCLHLTVVYWLLIINIICTHTHTHTKSKQNINWNKKSYSWISATSGIVITARRPWKQVEPHGYGLAHARTRTHFRSWTLTSTHNPLHLSVITICHTNNVLLIQNYNTDTLKALSSTRPLTFATGNNGLYFWQTEKLLELYVHNKVTTLLSKIMAFWDAVLQCWINGSYISKKCVTSIFTPVMQCQSPEGQKPLCSPDSYMVMKIGLYSTHDLHFSTIIVYIPHAANMTVCKPLTLPFHSQFFSSVAQWSPVSPCLQELRWCQMVWSSPQLEWPILSHLPFLPLPHPPLPLHFLPQILTPAHPK